MPCDWSKVSIGTTGLRCCRLGLGSSFGVEAADIEHAFERGIDYFYWGTYRRGGFRDGVARLATAGHRERMVVVVQSYTRVAALMRPSLESALRRLKLEYADMLLLGWWNATPPERILDAARALVERGRARHIMISCHDRPTIPVHARTPGVGAVMVRYNAAHPGAEEDVFPHLPTPRPGVIAYTATRWGDLLNPALVPDGEPVPRASDCYRFALTNPSVDVCLCGPANRAQVDEGMAALDRGPMDADEIAWMKRVGAAVKLRGRPQSGPVGIADRMMGARTP